MAASSLVTDSAVPDLLFYALTDKEQKGVAGISLLGWMDPRRLQQPGACSSKNSRPGLYFVVAQLLLYSSALFSSALFSFFFFKRYSVVCDWPYSRGLSREKGNRRVASNKHYREPPNFGPKWPQQRKYDGGQAVLSETCSLVSGAG